MSVQRTGRRGGERRALGWLGSVLLVACGGRTLQEASDDPGQNETAQDAPATSSSDNGWGTARFAPGAMTSTGSSAAAGAGGAPASSEPMAAGAGGWAGPWVSAAGSASSGWTGVGGSAQLQETCGEPYSPEPDWAPSEWIAFDASSAGAAAAPVPSLRGTMVGSWRGRVQTPWTSPYLVDITFDNDGHYSARELAGCRPAFYYGTDDDTPLKQWRVEDARGVDSGEIDIAFDYRQESGAIEYGLPAWQGKLSAIERNASGDGLRFEFWRSDGYGPLRFDLRRE